MTLDESTLAHFGPLQMEPAIVVTLPKGVAELSGEEQTTSATAARVPGGVLLDIRASSYGYFPGSVLAVIDDDGTTRWVRCSAETEAQIYISPASTLPDTAIVAAAIYPAGGDVPHAEYRLVSLADGSDQGTLRDHLAEEGIDAGAALDSDWPEATSDSVLLLAPPDGTIIDTSRDHLLRVDLRTLDAQLIPFPAVSAGTDSMYNGFRLDSAGNPYLYGSENGHDIVLSAYSDGEWHDRPAHIDAEVKIEYDYFAAEGQWPWLHAIDVNGTELWHRADIVGMMHEGFLTGQSGDVTIADACLVPITASGCDRPALVGVASDTGATRWVLEGQRGIVAFGDGYALVTDAAVGQDTPPAWIMIDTDTGEPVPGQRWDDLKTFEQECCGGDEFWYVHRDGGVLVAAHETQLAIWYPRDSGVTPHEVSLP